MSSGKSSLWICYLVLGVKGINLVCMDVNRAGRIRVIAPSYPTRWINIRSVLISISVEYPLCGYPHNLLISTDIHGYPRVFTKNKNKYLTIYFNRKFK